MRTQLTDFFPFNKYDYKCIKQLHTAQLRSNKNTVTPYRLFLYKSCTVIKLFFLLLLIFLYKNNNLANSGGGDREKERGRKSSSKLFYNLILFPHTVTSRRSLVLAGLPVCPTCPPPSETQRQKVLLSWRTSWSCLARVISCSPGLRLGLVLCCFWPWVWGYRLLYVCLKLFKSEPFSESEMWTKPSQYTTLLPYFAKTWKEILYFLKHRKIQLLLYCYIPRHIIDVADLQKSNH